MAYELNIEKKHKERDEMVEKQSIKLRKSINEKIFQAVEYLSDVPERYYIAKRISERIFKHEDNWTTSSVLGIGLKRALSEGHRICIDSLIDNEYSYILKLQDENDALKKELAFYKELAKQKEREGDI